MKVEVSFGMNLSRMAGTGFSTMEWKLMVLISASFTNIDYDPCNDYNILDNDWRSQVKLHRIYKLNAHERHHKVVITSGKLKMFFKPRVSELVRVSEKTCQMQWTQPKTKDMQHR